MSKAALKRRRKKEAAKKAQEEAGEELKTSARGQKPKEDKPKTTALEELKQE